MTFPTYDEIKQFIIDKPRATVCEIRDRFDQRGNHWGVTEFRGEECLVAYGINGDFYTYLLKFLKQDCVEWDGSLLDCAVSDSTRPPPGIKFLPLVFTIRPSSPVKKSRRVYKRKSK